MMKRDAPAAFHVAAREWGNPLDSPNEREASHAQPDATERRSLRHHPNSGRDDHTLQTRMNLLGWLATVATVLLVYGLRPTCMHGKTLR
jgi:hypothetical protein